MTVNTVRGGLAGKILRVDLSSGRLWTEDTMKYAEKFLGGRTLASYLLLTEMDPGITWSDPENMLIFSPGILAGTLVYGASRTSIDSKNVFNNGKGSANFGGNFGPELKLAGFDMIVITGKARRPLYLWIHDDVELRDAGSVWGTTTLETDRILREELNDDRVEIACIGPAGEHLAKTACIVGNCGKVAGGSGVGCIMGDKRLKAIVIHGNRSVTVGTSPTEFLHAMDRAWKKIMRSERTELWQTGTLMEAVELYPEAEINWAVRTIVRNGQDDFWPIEKRRNLMGIDRYRKKKWACFSCPFGGMPFNRIDDGTYAGTVGNGFWINSLWWNERLDVDDPERAVKYHCLLNELGLDGDNTTGAISWAFECYENGLLTKEDTDGLELTWGDGDAAIEMAKRVAYREGLGDLLADGVVSASRKLGKGSERFAIHMKGQASIDPYRVRKGWALGVATSPVSGRHLRGSVGSTALFGPFRYTFEAAGYRVDVDPVRYEHQPEMVIWQKLMKEIEDTTGLCMYLGSFDGGPLSPRDYCDLINAVTGLEWTMEDMMLFARRASNLEKAFNTIHAGFTREDDLPPARYMNEPVKTGPFIGEKLDRAEFDKMLDRYYELHNWDTKTGLQTRSCLVELGLEEIADMLKKVDRLLEK
jgi:aldehyde:ferredoxin oxidoreductase